MGTLILDTTATPTGLSFRKIQNLMVLHSVLLSTAQISMRGSPLPMVKPKEYHTQKLDTTATPTGLLFRKIRNLMVLHSVLLNIVPTSMRDILKDGKTKGVPYPEIGYNCNAN